MKNCHQYIGLHCGICRFLGLYLFLEKATRRPAICFYELCIPLRWGFWLTSHMLWVDFPRVLGLDLKHMQSLRRITRCCPIVIPIVKPLGIAVYPFLIISGLARSLLPVQIRLVECVFMWNYLDDKTSSYRSELFVVNLSSIRLNCSIVWSWEEAEPKLVVPKNNNNI